jgi:predicted nucleic acid-binding protein
LSSPTLVYIDPSVWLSYILKDSNEQKAVNAMARLERGDDKAIVSTLVILEILDVLRKRITERETYTGIDGSTRQRIKNRVDVKVRDFMDKITKLAHEGKAAIVDPDKNLQEYMLHARRFHSPHFGEIDTQSSCPVCRGPFGPRYKYRGPGQWDVQHAFNAKYTSVSEIISLDHGFDQLVGASDFSSLRITVL